MLHALLAACLASGLGLPGDLVPPTRPDRQERGAKVIIVGGYRDLSWRNRLRPESAWLIGAHLYRMIDARVVPVYGHDLHDALASAPEAVKAAGFQRITTLDFWGHGNPGSFRINRHRYRQSVFTAPSGRLAEAWAAVRALLADDAEVHWCCCSVFHGQKGQRFALAASEYLSATGKRITVGGHTRPIGLTFPGYHALSAGRRPNWSVHEGLAERHLDGVAVLVRDFFRIATATMYDAVPYLLETIGPRLPL